MDCVQQNEPKILGFEIGDMAKRSVEHAISRLRPVGPCDGLQLLDAFSPAQGQCPSTLGQGQNLVEGTARNHFVKRCQSSRNWMMGSIRGESIPCLELISMVARVTAAENFRIPFLPKLVTCGRRLTAKMKSMTGSANSYHRLTAFYPFADRMHLTCLWGSPANTQEKQI